MSAFLMPGGGGGGGGGSGLINVTGLQFFIRTAPVSGTIANAAPPGSLVTATAHGLHINDPVAFSIIRTWVPVTSISSGTPALITKTAHGLAVGDPIAFINSGNGVLNTGLTPNLTYYVTNNGAFNANQFNVSDTQAHALAGTNTINTSSAGTGTQVFYRTGQLPPNVIEGAVYYVISTGFNANQFQFSATIGGPAVDTSGTQSGYFVFSTGNDSNGGQSQTRTGAFMTVQGAANYFSDKTVTDDFVPCYLSDGTYYESVVLGTQIGGSNSNAEAGFGFFSNSFVSENVIVRGVAANGWAFAGMGAGNWTISQMTVEVSGGGGNAIENFGVNTHVFLQTVNFGNCSCPILSGATFDHGGEVYLTGNNNKITSASQSIGFFADKYGYLEISHGTLLFCVNPAWPYFIRAERGSNTYINRGDFTYTNAAVFTGNQLFVDTAATVVVKVGRFTDLPGVATSNMIEGGWVNDSTGTYTYVAFQDRTWFINPSTGSDENPGSVGAPFRTIQYAANYVAKYDWYLGFQPTIQLADSLLYSENNIVLPQLKNLWVYLNRFAKILGSASTNVKITDVPGNGVFYLEGSMSWWYVSGVGLDTPYIGFKVYNSAYLTLGEIGFTDATAGGNCTIVWCETLATINWVGSGTSKLTITNPGGGGTVGGTVFLGFHSCRIDIPGVQFVFPAGSPSVPNLGLFDLQGNCVAFFSGSTWTGGADLSTQYFIRNNCALNTTNGLLSDLPGIATNNYQDASSVFCAETSGRISNSAVTPSLRPNGHVRRAIVTKTASYTPLINDAGHIIEMNVATPNTFTVPPNASLAYPIGTEFQVTQIGTGATTIVAGAGVTIDNVGAISAQWASAALYKRGTNEWVMTFLPGGGSGTGANPTATASDVAVNGVATTFMRSDAAPAVQKTSASVFGLCKVDGTTVTAAAGVISSTGGGTPANPTATASDVAVNGVLTTYMRSDAAPAVQKTSSSVFGLCKVDGTTITATGGVISSTGGGGGTPGGPSGSIEYNNSGAFGGFGNVTSSVLYLKDLSGSPAAWFDSTNDNIVLGKIGNSTISGANNTCIGDYAGISLTTGTRNHLWGFQAGYLLTTGGGNVCIGTAAGQNLLPGTSGIVIVGGGSGSGGTGGDVFVGNGVGASGTSGGLNVAVGSNSMSAMNGGSANVALGSQALAAVLAGSNNLAMGVNALNACTGGNQNVAIGQGALDKLTTGSGNVCLGAVAGKTAIVTGNANMGLGGGVLQGGDVSNCTAIGGSALTVVTGDNNLAIGQAAGFTQTSGTFNLIIGTQADGIGTGSNNTVIGSRVALTGNPSGCIVLADGNGVKKLDYNYTLSGSWTHRGAATFQDVTTTASAANAVLDNSSTPANNLLRSTSSLRYKTAIRDVPKERILALNALRPIEYQSLAKADKPSRRFIGYAAEHVHDIDPDLVSYDNQGRPDSVMYDRVLLLKIEALSKRVEELERKLYG